MPASASRKVTSAAGVAVGVRVGVDVAGWADVGVCVDVAAITLVLVGSPALTDELADRLYEAGCDDGTPGSCDGVVSIDFHREAASLEEAIRSAVANVRAAGCEVSSVVMQPDALAA